MTACGTFTEVFRSTSDLTNLGSGLRHVRYRGAFVVYRNTEPTR